MKKLFKRKKKEKIERKTKAYILNKLKIDRRIIKVFVIILALSIVSNITLGITQHLNIVEREREINEKQIELDDINNQIIDLTEQLENGKIKVTEYEEKINSLEQEKQDLSNQLQAKLNAAASSSSTAYAASIYRPTGSCSDWIVQAGISDVDNAYTLIMRESGCNVNAVNPSSGACGIPQALPCSKLGAARGNPVAEIQWMNSYVIGRYGSWANAVAFWNANHWY